MPDARSTGEPVTEEPTYWFVVMEMAKRRGDFERAANAKRQLERLGVHISFRHPRTRQEGGDHAA